MKKTLLAILLLACTGFMVQDVSSKNSCDHDDVPIYIPLPPIPTPKPPINKPIPLSLVQDVEATYYAGTLSIVFNSDLGNADITVTNNMTGEMWLDDTNGMGVSTLYISDSEGYYTIYITTDSGDYAGEFVI
ncbi:MAG: DUF3244 domain-containing protein [Alistipes sp.]|nr:DUF3244 domain-containing protein [Alistipes sp.]